MFNLLKKLFGKKETVVTAPVVTTKFEVKKAPAKKPTTKKVSKKSTKKSK